MERSGRGVRALQALVLATGSLVLCLGAIEVGLRLFWDGYYLKYDPRYPYGEFEFHPTRGLALVPGLDRMDHAEEFRVVQKHNSRGFRGPEFPAEKPPGRTRVLTIGDSFTYGSGVEYEETYAAVMERLDPRLQVINLGVPMYSGAEELMVLREEIGSFQPDVVVALYLWNDLYGAYRALYTRFELRDGELVFLPPDPPTFEHPTFDDIRRRQQRRARRYQNPIRRTYLYRLLSDRLEVAGAALRDWRNRTRAELGDPGRSKFELTGEEEAAWELSFALLREMANVSRSHGAQFAILIAPDRAQIERNLTVYEVPEHLWEVQERIVGFARREGIPFVDVLPALRELRDAGGPLQYFPRNGHWNRVGHAQVAEILLTELRRQGMLPGEA